MPDIRLPDDDDAPLFKLFWQNGELNETTGRLMAERIGVDSTTPYRASRPRFASAPTTLTRPTHSSGLQWSNRQSERTFANKPITTEQLSELCWPFAERPKATQEVDTRHLASGGAKYPILIYAAFLHVIGSPALQNKLAWYDPHAHGFTPFADCPTWETLAPILSVDWTTSPSVVFFVTARSAGSLAKYGERGGRFVLLEAGSYMGALGFEASRLKLSGCAIGSFRDRAVADLLQLQDHEWPVVAFGCGTRE